MGTIDSVTFNNNAAHAELICYATLEFLKLIKNLPLKCKEEIQRYGTTIVDLHVQDVLNVMSLITENDYADIEESLIHFLAIDNLSVEFDFWREELLLRITILPSGDEPDGGLENELEYAEDLACLHKEVIQLKSFTAHA